MTAEAVFRAKAPVLMKCLMAENFGFGVDDAAAVAGNAGHESGGFTKLQEIKPVVKGSRGGYGWFQWTGPRRRAYEKYCADKKLNLVSDEANTQFVIFELKGPERAAVPKTKAALTLADKVVAFEMAYERAGVKHYPSRLQWAQIARDAYYKGQETQPMAPKPVEPPKVEPTPTAPPPAPRPPYKPSIQLVMAVIGGIAALVAAFFGLK
jgi:hypothetical protein